MHDALAERSGVSYDEYTPEQRHDLAKQVQAYLDASPEGEESVFNIVSLRHVWEIFKQFKIITNNARSDAETRLREQFVLQSKQAAAGTPAATAGSMQRQESMGAGGGMDPSMVPGFVGDLENGGGYSVGTAPPGARPASVDTLVSKRPQMKAMQGGEGEGGEGVREGASVVGGEESLQGSPSGNQLQQQQLAAQQQAAADAGLSGGAPMDRNRVFTVFKAGPGRELNTALIESKTVLRKAKQRAQGLTATANECKYKIDSLEAMLDEKKKEADAFASNKSR